MKRVGLWLTIFIAALVLVGWFGVRLGRTVPPVPAGLLAAEKGYGTTIDLTQTGEKSLEATLDSLRQHGLRWIRQPVRWSELEVVAGEYDWQALDQGFSAVARLEEPGHMTGPQRSFEVIAVLQTTPRWARSPDQSATAPPTDLRDFGNFARSFAARYGHQIDYYQIWHEPNLSAGWGHTFVDPVAYASLLREAALNIRAVDPDAVILTAALAPTLEIGPLNMNELDYLTDLYRAGAARWFDVVAGQPYGFDSEPFDPARPDLLNFSRLELLRGVMLDHGDVDTPVWATAFGWNALPARWLGTDSPWKSDLPLAQARRTALAIERARRDWPWLGPMLAVRWDTTDLASDDPARGFAISEISSILAAIERASTVESVATPGRFPAGHVSGSYQRPDWRFSRIGADIPRASGRSLTMAFEGTRLDLTVNRGLFRGYLWVTVDGRPAPALPQDDRGRSYIVLYDPLRERDSVTVARHLPPGRYQVVIEADGGWGQWAINGWTVYHETDLRLLKSGLIAAGLLAAISGFGLWRSVANRPGKKRERLASWERVISHRAATLGDGGQIVFIFGLLVCYFLVPSWFWPFILVALACAIGLRPDLGLAVIVFGLSFLSGLPARPVMGLTPLELLLVLVAVGFAFKTSLLRPRILAGLVAFRLKSSDWAALSLVVLALISTLVSENFGVSMFAWRTIVLASVVFYFLVRLGFDCKTVDRRALPGPAIGNPGASVLQKTAGQPGGRPEARWIWRLVDAFVAGATLHATGALLLYFLTDQYITAEGVRRAVGPIYESPNHLALFLGRVWPILLAVSVLAGQSRARRGLYGAGLGLTSLALFLTFSRGFLLVGLPVATLVMAVTYLWPHRGRHRYQVVGAVAGGLVVLLLALIPFNQTARLYRVFSLSQGSTGFFRLRLWQASLQMLADNWLTGVGVDNFLYRYRTRYIRPDAWQEPNLSHPHNLLLDFGTRLGLAGIGLLLWLQLAFWTNAWRLYRRGREPLVLGLIGSMAVFIGHGLVDNAYFLPDLAFTFFLVIGLVQRLAAAEG